jgi:phytoene dehydrogenase-like protein
MSLVVVGGGVNGLACAVELARAGKKVTVLEQRGHVGGLAARRTFGDGFTVPGIRHDTSEIRPALVESLGLGARGLALLSEHVPVFAAGDGAGLVLHASPDAAREEIKRRSAKDVEAYAGLRGLMAHLRPVLEPLLDRAPPPLLPRGFGETIEMGLMGLKLRGLGPRDMVEVMRAAPMCVADWLREQFETEILSATLAFHAVVGDFVGPWSPGTGAMLIVRDALLVPGAKGGPAAVVDALVKAAGALGVTVRTGARVTRIRVEAGRVRGVVLAGGDDVPCDAVVAACSPHAAMNALLPPLALTVRDTEAVRTIRTRGTAAKIHLALAEPPKWKARPSESFERARVGGAHLDDLERAFDATKYRELPARPVLDVWFPPGDRSGGACVASVLVHAVPPDLAGGWTDASKKALLDRALAVLDEAAPGVQEAVKASEVLTPIDIQDELAIPGGSIHHVERALDQMVLMRPARPLARYATPIEGLFLGSSGCHPGPGVTLVPGVLAARALLGR